MGKTGLSADEIKEKAIDITIAHMQTYGYKKVKLTAVAKELGISHAALYIHFSNKEALLDAVSERWLLSLEQTLARICKKNKEPLVKIHEWFSKLHNMKRKKVLDDPELYKSLDTGYKHQKPYFIDHIKIMNAQLIGLVEEAVADKKLTKLLPQETASLLVEAMTAFHNPTLVAYRADEKRDDMLKNILDCIFAGLS